LHIGHCGFTGNELGMVHRVCERSSNAPSPALLLVSRRHDISSSASGGCVLARCRFQLVVWGWGHHPLLLLRTAALLQVAAYESFYRRVLRRAPRTALMSVAAFSFSATPIIQQGRVAFEAPNAFASTGEMPGCPQHLQHTLHARHVR